MMLSRHTLNAPLIAGTTLKTPLVDTERSAPVVEAILYDRSTLFAWEGPLTAVAIEICV